MDKTKTTEKKTLRPTPLHGKTLLNYLFTISTSLSTCWYVRAQGREWPVQWLHVQFSLEFTFYPVPELRLLSSQRRQLESLVSLYLLVLAETVQEREHYVRDVLFPYRIRTAWDNYACGLVVWCKFWRPDLPETLLAQGKWLASYCGATRTHMGKSDFNHSSTVVSHELSWACGLCWICNLWAIVWAVIFPCF